MEIMWRNYEKYVRRGTKIKCGISRDGGQETESRLYWLHRDTPHSGGVVEESDLFPLFREVRRDSLLNRKALVSISVSQLLYEV